MLLNIKKFADTSETLKEAKKNVKEMSLAKEIAVFIGLYAITLFIPLILNGIIEVSLILSNQITDYTQILVELYGVIFIPITIYFIVTKIEKRSWRSIGFSKNNIISSCLKGLFIGFVMFFVVVVIGFALGQYKYNGFDLSSAIFLIPFFFGFLIQSFGEEIHERGWTLTFISKRHNVIIAMILSSVFFSLEHLLNSGIDLLSLINIVLIGFFFAVLFLKYDNIWICGCAHTAWNFSQGIIFGFNVSGTVTPSLLKFSQTSSNLIGGGEFGPESGLIATVVTVIALVIALYYTKK